MSDNYQRLFYILKNMDSDIGYPTGYIKVEINCEVARLHISLNNLLDRQGLIYQLYGIKKYDRQLIYTVICDVPNENGRANVKISADIHKIGSSKLKLEEINVFAIIAQVPNRTPLIKCPLVAYTKGEILWKTEFEALILNKELLTSNDKMDQGNGSEQIPDILSEIGLFQDINAETDATEEIKVGETVTIDDVENGETDNSEEVGYSEIEVLDIMEKAETKVSKDIQPDNVEILEYQHNLEQEFDMMEGNTLHDDAELNTNKKSSIAGKFESAVTNIYSTNKSTVLGHEETPEAVLVDNDILSAVQKNFNDISSIEIDADKIKNELNMPNLKEELYKSFESYNPFKMKSKNFKWWKINSPGYLNNILFRNNIKTYLLFNPKVMLAHYKYRYIIFGIRNDKHSGKEYFICGVPGVYSIDENPFGNMGSWAQIEGYRPKYGAFGYWIILIDPRTGKLIKVK